MESGESILKDQACKLKGELLILDSLTNEARKVSQFKAWDEQWSENSINEKLGPLGDYVKKGEVLTKVLKNMLAGFKSDKGPKECKDN